MRSAYGRCAVLLRRSSESSVPPWVPILSRPHPDSVPVWGFIDSVDLIVGPSGWNSGSGAPGCRCGIYCMNEFLGPHALRLTTSTRRINWLNYGFFVRKLEKSLGCYLAVSSLPRQGTPQSLDQIAELERFANEVADLRCTHGTPNHLLTISAGENHSDIRPDSYSFS